MNVSIILPAYNEAENIPLVLKNVESGARRLNLNYEIIVVDDGSGDGTAEVVKDYAAAHQTVKLVQHEVNKGYGDALRTGFNAAKLEWIFFMDADRQFMFEEIEKLLPHVGHKDFIIGYREKRHDALIRSVNSAIFNFAIWILFSLNVKDLNCAFKLMRTEYIKKMDLSTGGALINAEILIKAKKFGARIVEVPVSHYPRVAGNPTGAKPHVIFRAMAELLKLRLRI